MRTDGKIRRRFYMLGPTADLAYRSSRYLATLIGRMPNHWIVVDCVDSRRVRAYRLDMPRRPAAHNPMRNNLLASVDWTQILTLNIIVAIWESQKDATRAQKLGPGFSRAFAAACRGK